MRHGTLVYTTYEEIRPGEGEAGIRVLIPVVYDAESQRWVAADEPSSYSVNGLPVSNENDLGGERLTRLEDEAWEHGCVFEDDREHEDE